MEDRPAFIPPIVAADSRVQGFHVRLTLSVGAAGATIAPGLEIDDCGKCPFCLDKPKYGGSGTRRQKCELKQEEATRNVDDSSAPTIWGKLHLITGQEREQMLETQKLPLPEPLIKAMEIGPLPLVWAYRRKPRARPVPPAYVLMYYCEERVPLDRSQLAISRQRHFKNSRRPDPTSNGKPKERKPRQRKQQHPDQITPSIQPVLGPSAQQQQQTTPTSDGGRGGGARTATRVDKTASRGEVGLAKELFVAPDDEEESAVEAPVRRVAIVSPRHPLARGLSWV